MRRTLLALSLSFAALAGFAQTPAEEAEHQALRNIKVMYERAVNEDRLDLLKPYFATPFYGVMLTSKRVSTLDEMKQYWNEMKQLMGPGGMYHVTVIPERSVLMGDFALARGVTQDVVRMSDGKMLPFGTNWTAVLHKEGGTWKVLQVQGSMDPIHNPFVMNAIRVVAIRIAVIIGIIALILGLLVGWLIGRRRAVA
jgi:ketosteroid isomerase-like protein